mgnify:CR=1 FL=1
MDTSWKDEEYQGWTNYYTWNVALYLNNEAAYYRKVGAFKAECSKGNCERTYDDFVQFANLQYARTGDGVSFTDSRIDKEQIINDCIFCE